MRTILDNIDYKRLAGTTTILGVDVTPERARVVVMKRSGHPFNRFTGNFRVLKSFSCSFEPGMPDQQRAHCLRECIDDQKIPSRSVVGTVRSMGVKFVLATVPADVGNITEWIREEHEKLIKLPIPSNQLSFRYEIIERTTAGISIEIAFVRNSEIEEQKAFFTAAGLDLLALGGGARDILNPLIIDPSSEIGQAVNLVYVDEHTISIISFHGGIRSPLKISPAAAGSSIASQMARLGFEKTTNPLLVAGDTIDAAERETCRLFQPFGLSPEYALAAGLAIKGFVPEISPVNFLSDHERERNDVRIARSLLHRVALVLGSLTLMLLALQFLAALFLQKSIDSLDEQMNASGAIYAEVLSLEQQVKDLEGKISGNESALQHTNTARMLHEIARVIPHDVRLEKLSFNTKESSQSKLLLEGAARSQEAVAEFLRKLETSGLCSDPKLIRSGTRAAAGQFEAEPSASQDVLRFEISAGIQ